MKRHDKVQHSGYNSLNLKQKVSSSLRKHASIEARKEKPVIIPIAEYCNFKRIKDPIKFKDFFNKHAEDTKPFYSNSNDNILTAYGVIDSEVRN